MLKPFCSLADEINPVLKKRMIYLVSFMLYGTCYCWYSIIGMGIQLTLLSRMLESIALIIVLIFLGLNRQLEPVKWNRFNIYIWFIFGMLIFVMGFFNEQNTGYWMTGPVIALGLPCFYMVYGKKEKYELLFDAICKSAIIISIIYFFICIGGEYISDNVWDISNRYNGLTIDANKIGELCLASFCCIIYFIYINKNKIWKLVSIVSLGMIIGQVYLTQSRTTILAMIVIITFYLIVLIKDSFNSKNIGIIIKPVGILLIAMLVAIISSNVVSMVHSDYIGSKSKENELTSAEIDVKPENVEKAETTQTQTMTSETEYRDLLPEKGSDLNSFSSGRLFIWQTYSEGFNWIGNPADAENPISPLIRQRTAHNSFVEITYRSGYITGIIYLILVLITGIHILKVMFRNNRKNTNGDYFMAITAIGYIIFTSLMSSFNPLTAIIFLLYAIAFPVLLDNNSDKKELKKQNLSV